jgi:hypothetical protein
MVSWGLPLLDKDGVPNNGLSTDTSPCPRAHFQLSTFFSLMSSSLLRFLQSVHQLEPLWALLSEDKLHAIAPAVQGLWQYQKVAHWCRPSHANLPHVVVTLPWTLCIGLARLHQS